MSWSLALSNGDFTVTNAQLGVVTNEKKLTQDLRCALLQRMGTDPLHLTYGSLIDGGMLPDGTVVPGVVGEQNLAQAALTVQSEIQRICLAYQTQQLNRAKADRITYNRVSLSPAECLVAISDIQVTQQQDQLIALVKLQTAQGQDINVVFPLSTS